MVLGKGWSGGRRCGARNAKAFRYAGEGLVAPGAAHLLRKCSRSLFADCFEVVDSDLALYWGKHD